MEYIAVRGLTISKLKFFKQAAMHHAHPGACPYSIVDYRNALNPYEARYGECWEEKIKKCSMLSAYVCVKDLILHIDQETAQAFKGTRYENQYFFS